MASISEVGIICPSCSWRNTGASRDCRHCGELLVPQYLEAGEAHQWAASQMMLRKSKGLPNDHDVETTLMDWLAPIAQSSSAGLESREVPSWVPGGGSVAVEAEEEFSAPVARVCPSCEATYSEPVKFCSECGTETVAPETGDLIAQLEESVRILNRRVRQLEAVPSDVTSREFSWANVPDNEKWSLTWGVFGRTILINVGIFIALVVVMVSLGFIAGT